MSGLTVLLIGLLSVIVVWFVKVWREERRAAIVRQADSFNR
ncbi:MAG: hypothetical protein OEZ43_08645 [Gammaproteobacteria bacterium]|nr:hypothetical protein [Gammaproteobacteria bacterium]